MLGLFGLGQIAKSRPPLGAVHVDVESARRRWYRPAALFHSLDKLGSPPLPRLTSIPNHWLRQKLPIACLAVGLAAAAASGASAATGAASLLATKQACPAGVRRDAPLDVQVRAMACLVAFARARAGVRPLRPSAKLDRVAALKIDADLACHDFSHTPCGSDFLTWFVAAGYERGSSRYAVGENLAWGRGGDATPEKIMRMWLDSPEHRRNLLSPRWRQFGLAVRLKVEFLGDPGVAVWANEFGSR